MLRVDPSERQAWEDQSAAASVNTAAAADLPELVARWVLNVAPQNRYMLQLLFETILKMYGFAYPASKPAKVPSR